MCGICGIVSLGDLAYPELKLEAMQNILHHRGPDDSGHYLGSGIALGSRRLAILDLSQRGHMPMSTPNGRYWITYNGEVYNYRTLRSALDAKGYTIRSNTDTEVVLYLYMAEGPAMLNRLNGMFALAIWDSQERSLFLARDRFGVKPLYYAWHQGALYFASEEKALFAAGVAAQFDHSTWEELLCFRYVAGDRTSFHGVRRLLPGHYLIWQNGEIQIRRWWKLAEQVEARREDLPHDPVRWYRETFDDAVNLRRISDVPLGVLLSGGLDSSSVAASLAGQAPTGISSFTVRFTEPKYDEGLLARQVINRWQLDGHELYVSPHELLPKLRQALWLNDEPLAHGNDLHLFAISEYAKPKVKVLLSGEGADETLGGYVRYQPLRYPALLALAQSGLNKFRKAESLNGRWRKLTRFLELGPLDRFVFFNACDVLPTDLEMLGLRVTNHFSFRQQVLSEAQSLYPDDLVRQAMYSDQHTFLCSVLDRNDRMTMGASIECRVPFLDYRLVTTLAALPTPVLFKGFRSKYLLRRGLGSRLPTAVLRHRKWGFGVPWRYYLRQVPELRQTLEDLDSASLLLDAPLDRTAVRRTVRNFLTGDDQSYPLVMQLLMITLGWDAMVSGLRSANDPMSSGRLNSHSTVLESR